MSRLVAYYRVSTQQQGRSGLGLDAQKISVSQYATTGHDLIAEFTEVESGGRRDRPQLNAALDACRRQKATLVIAKLDRLARNVAFISALLESKVRFVAVDMPEADVTFLQMAAVFAEYEARRISERTRAALAAAKVRGTALGWSIPGREGEQRLAAERGAEVAKLRARQHSKNVIPIIENIRDAGITTLMGIAIALNSRGIATARGGNWHATTVRNVLARSQIR